MTVTTAYDWHSYLNRCSALRILRANYVNVDTVIKTKDSSYSDTVHWQAFSALSLKLKSACELKSFPKKGIEEKVDDGHEEESSAVANHDHVAEYYHSRQIKSHVIERLVILPDDVDEQLARQLIHCAYGTKFNLDQNSFEKLYKLAIKYKIRCAIKICLEYARSLLSITNCIQLFNLALRHKYKPLKEVSYKLIRSNIKIVIHTNEYFHTLPVEYLKRLLADNKLSINEDEEFSWLIILKWFSSNNDTDMQQYVFQETYNQMLADEGAHLADLTSSISDLTKQPLPRPFFNHYSHLLPPVDMCSQLTKSPSNLTKKSTLNEDEDKMWHRLDLCSRPTTYIEKNQKQYSIYPDNDVVDTQSSIDYSIDKMEKDLISVLKELRFLRFRSLAAFTVILTNKNVAASREARLLVEEMRLRYIVDRKLELSAEQAISLSRRKDLPPVRPRKPVGYFKRRSARLLTRVLQGLAIVTGAPTSTADWRLGDDNSRTFVPSTNTGLRQPNNGNDTGGNKTPPPNKRLDFVNSTNNEKCYYRKLKKQANNSKQQQAPRHVGFKSLKRASKPRVPVSVAIMVGGWAHGQVKRTMLSYDFVSDSWYKLRPRLPQPVAFHGCASDELTGNVYIVGGTDGKEILNSLFTFNLSRDIFAKTGRFRFLKPMHERRCHLNAVWHLQSNSLFAIGGHNGFERLKSVEKYDKLSGNWLSVSEMTIARSDAGACIHDNKIFVAGGQISDQFIQASVEFYKPSEDTWTFVAPMLIPRMSFQLVSYRNMLLAVAGTNGLLGAHEAAFGPTTRSVERFSPIHASWSFCAPLAARRAAFCSFILDDRLYAVGGFNGERRVKTCECLEITHLDIGSNHPTNLLRASIRLPTIIEEQEENSNINQSDQQNEQEVAENNNNILNARTQNGNNLSQTQNDSDQLILVNSQRRPQTQLITETESRSLPTGFNQRLTRVLGGQAAIISANGDTVPRQMMRWVKKSKIPSSCSGFAVCVVTRPKNIDLLTYHGARIKKNPKNDLKRLIKRKSKWSQLKIMRRKTLLKHTKIALVIGLVAIFTFL